MARLTSLELRAMKEKQDWNSLWKAAMPWVRFAATSVRGSDREDMIQEALINVGRAIPRWDPNQGEFSTYVQKIAKNKMLNFQRDKRRRDESSRHFGDGMEESHEDGTPSPLATYCDTGHVPRGFRDPAEELASQHAAETVEQFLSQLDSLTDQVLREMVGMPVLDEHGDEKYIKDLAKSRGIPATTLVSRLEVVRKSFVAKRRTGYVRDTHSIYPPEGREPWVTNLQANKNHAGFWIGQADIVDTDVWRESTGTVWKDWSWKPTDEDILRGARK
jgi:RNA polymerase sigma factor (sigma-70 family)